MQNYAHNFDVPPQLQDRQVHGRVVLPFLQTCHQYAVQLGALACTEVKRESFSFHKSLNASHGPDVHGMWPQAHGALTHGQRGQTATRNHKVDPSRLELPTCLWQ